MQTLHSHPPPFFLLPACLQILEHLKYDLNLKYMFIINLENTVGNVLTHKGLSDHLDKQWTQISVLFIQGDFPITASIYSVLRLF